MIQPKYMGGLGLRDLECFNLTVLARRAWRILHDALSLSVTLLKAICFFNGNLLEAQLGSSPSEVWCAICEEAGVLKHEL
jgi:hypothetical protein